MVGLELPDILMLYSLANEEKQVAIWAFMGGDFISRGTMGILATRDLTVYIV